MDTAGTPTEPHAARQLPPDHLISTRVAAEFLGLSTWRLNRMVREGVEVRPADVVGRGGRGQRIKRSAVLALAGQSEDR